MPTIRVAIAGATGYTGEELIRLLLGHPHVQLTHLAASAKWERPVPVSSVYPRLGRGSSLSIQSLDPDQLASADAVFLALPHGMAMELAPTLLQKGVRVIDLSGDFRLQDPALYPQWYKFSHAQPGLLASSVYGLTEYARKELGSAKLVANPGCYATSILLAVLPLFQAKLIPDGKFLVDAKSGLTGAGRKAETTLLFTEMAENLRPYKVHSHQHTPEILQAVKRLTGAAGRMGFVPQVIPVSRGLISMIYISGKADLGAVEAAYRKAYPEAAAPFVRVRAAGSLPQIRDVAETNFCDIGFAYEPTTETLTVVSAIDNLTKGASGQAVQNLNVMFGFPETAGLS